MNKVMLVGRLTRDPELRSLPSGKHVATFSVATNEFRGGNNERADRVPRVRGPGPPGRDLRSVPVEGPARGRRRPPPVNAPVGRRRRRRHWKTEVVVARWRCSPAARRRSTPGRRRPWPMLRRGHPDRGERRGRGAARGRRRHVTHRATGLLPGPVARAVQPARVPHEPTCRRSTQSARERRHPERRVTERRARAGGRGRRLSRLPVR